MILADARVWIDYLNGHTGAAVDRLDGLLDRADLAIDDLTITEVLQGIRSDRLYQQTLFQLGGLPLIRVGDRAVAIEAAQNYRLLRARGITIRKTIDTLLATRCIIDGHSLLFSDRDFDPFVTHLGLRSAMSD